MAKNTKKSDLANYALAAARVLLGFIFLWAFLDKLFGLGKATPSSKSWLEGGSPTTGFLSNAGGPFADFFQSLAGLAWADWLFMLGLLGIGVALILGIALRLAAVAGSLMLLLMWAAVLPIANNPFVDDHIIYVVILIAIAANSTQKWSLQNTWRSLAVVKTQRWLW